MENYAKELKQVINEAELKGLDSDYMLARKIICIVCNPKTDEAYEFLTKKMFVKGCCWNLEVVTRLINVLHKYEYIFLLTQKRKDRRMGKMIALKKYWEIYYKTVGGFELNL